MPAMSKNAAEDQVTRLFQFFANSAVGPDDVAEYRDWMLSLDVPLETARAVVTIALRRFQWLPKPVQMDPILDELRGDDAFRELKDRVKATCIAAFAHRKAHDGAEAGWTLRKILVGHREVCVEERDASWQDKGDWDLRIRTVDALITEIDARREGIPVPAQAALDEGAGE